MRAFPETATRSARALLFTRGVRGFADGVVSVLLARYLIDLGYSDVQVGALVTGTLLGSAALTIAVGLVAHRLDRKRLLFAASGLMLLTGVGFYALRDFWPLMLVAVVGTLNPSAGDVSVFLPTEQAVLSESIAPRERTLLFSIYNVVGSLAGAVGALAAGFPDPLARRFGLSMTDAERLAFLLYAAVAVVAFAGYVFLTPQTVRADAPRAPLAKSLRVVLQLSALFSLDSFGGGFVVTSLLVLWLYRRFSLETETAAAIFSASGVLTSLSQFASPRIAARIGLVRTMVYTHLPANLFLIAAGLMPSAPLAVLFLLLRASLSSMDVPARQSYVMAVVPPEERAAASSVTNVPRSLASALPPLLAGWMLQRSTFGWPLVVAGALKAAYDLLLLWRFRSSPLPPGEG